MLENLTTIESTPIKSVNIATAHPPARFYERFASDGSTINPNWPRLTTEESEQLFEPRSEGLKILLINPPIREWSYPNIMPIGQGYIAAVAAMDGHHVDVLDLNAERKEPIKKVILVL